MVYLRRILGIFAACLAVFASFGADAAVGRFFAGHRSALGTAFAEFFNKAGDWPVLMFFGVLVGLVAWKEGRPRVVRWVVAMMLAASLAGLGVNVLRGATGRPRPYVKVEDRFYGVKKDGHWIVRSNSYNSFPSAHTAVAAGFAGVLLFGAARWRWLVLLFPLAVGCARLYTGSHHFSDVVAALLLGLLAAGLVWRRLFAESANEN